MIEDNRNNFLPCSKLQLHRTKRNQNQPCLGRTRLPAHDTGYTHLFHCAFTLLFLIFVGLVLIFGILNRQIKDPQKNFAKALGVKSFIQINRQFT